MHFAQFQQIPSHKKKIPLTKYLLTLSFISYLLRMRSIHDMLHIHPPCLKVPMENACSALQHRHRSLPFRSLQECMRLFRRRRHRSCPSLSAGMQPDFHQIHVSVLQCTLHPEEKVDLMMPMYSALASLDPPFPLDPVCLLSTIPFPKNGLDLLS